ncbi:MAG: LysM peptidoglycan-binding domain-containing protein [Deltaproteobacteria bacterium]|nr:LysM peptidoglycan-binding domain-containing protein [Deltaproteobacteria bacterium]
MGPTFSQEGGEETYSISLVQTAESDKEIHEIEGRKVLTETYTVRKGDHLWQLLRKRGLLEKRELPELLAALKRLNSTFSNLDLIHPGEKIMIPLTLSPVKGLAGILPKEPPQPIPLADLKDLKLESYTVRPGDSLIKIVKTHYGLSDHQITEECLEQIHRLNPQIADLNILYPDQMVRLPVHTPHFVRAPVKPAGEKRMRVEGQKAGSPSADKEFTALGYQLQEIFTLMGEEWVNTGEHYIPLRSGGQINLKAESFPVANLSNGKRIVVDLYRELPERMAYVITSNWENYRVAQIQDRDDLRSALNKIFPLCEFHKLYRSGEPFELVGDIYFRITADWIIIPSPDPQGSREQAILINLPDEKGPRIPHELKDFLAVQGIKTIEYPPLSSLEPASPFPSEVLKAGHDKARIIETVLNLAGQAFTRNMELPLHSDGKGGFSMTVKADFFLYLDKKEAIIDFSGIGNEMIPLLNEYKVSVLSVAAEADPGIIVSKILEFIGIRFDSKPRAFTTAGSGESKNIMVTIPGISFQDETGKSIFASSVDIPDEIAGFLSRKGYKVLSLSSS